MRAVKETLPVTSLSLNVRNSIHEPRQDLVPCVSAQTQKLKRPKIKAFEILKSLQTRVETMKHILFSVLLAIVASAPALAQFESAGATSKRNVERQLFELERELSDALVREDAAVLARLWSNDLVFTFPNGKVSNKAERLAGQGPAQLFQSSNDAVKVYVYGNTAVVTVLSTWRGKANNQEYSSQFQATHVW